MLDNSPLGFEVSVRTGEQERKSYGADSEARKTIQDRIFIAKRIQEEKILERWQLLTAEGDISRFWDNWNELHASLVKAAQEVKRTLSRRCYNVVRNEADGKT